MRLGQFEIHALSDGTFALDGGQMFGVVPKVLWEKKAPPDERNRIRMGLTCLLVHAHGKNIVIETGIGDKMNAKQTGIYKIEHSTALPAELQKLGVALNEVDLVINTHLHFDHCGWNVSREVGSTSVATAFGSSRVPESSTPPSRSVSRPTARPAKPSTSPEKLPMTCVPMNDASAVPS